jgi:hypothetical protein
MRAYPPAQIIDRGAAICEPTGSFTGHTPVYQQGAGHLRAESGYDSAAKAHLAATRLPRWTTAFAQIAARAQSRIAGNSTTSRIDLRPVSTITSRSIPMPTPPVGGMPCSSAWMNASS